MRELLTRYGEAGVRSLMDFGLGAARQSKFRDMQSFGVLSIFEGEWKARREKQDKVRESQVAIASCAVCNEAGMLEFEDSTVTGCPHDLPAITHIQRKKPIRGFPAA